MRIWRSRSTRRKVARGKGKRIPQTHRRIIRTPPIVKGKSILRRLLHIACRDRIEEIAVRTATGLGLVALAVWSCEAELFAVAGAAAGALGDEVRGEAEGFEAAGSAGWGWRWGAEDSVCGDAGNGN